MINLKTILVPIDFSLSSQTALDYAAAFGADFGAQIHLLCVVEEESLTANIGGDPLNTRDSWRKENLKKLNEFVPAKYQDLDIIKRVEGGLTYEAILKYAQENNIDLIIMGANGQTGFIESWLGGTTYEVARKAPCAVLTVKPEGFGFIKED
ncbi:MAG: universal stress protein [Candidatus Riflebacteria bacterium]|nr:universal stress protein [Candidatus Riflebacteria bacterium]MBR4570547.1 universal stress protein [Candidatus Riflebacteria bacterium]